MSCLFPIAMSRDADGNVCSSKHEHTQFYVPCGQCGECRLSRARSWATRCVHESTMWKTSCFITLTYKDLPKDKSLNPDDTRNFIRRFRESFRKPFKYFLVGEYGDHGDRPHYHALIFGHDFGLSDYRNHHRLGHDSNNSRTTDLSVLHDTDALNCPELTKIWGLGFTSVGDLTFDSAAYCAQYAMKKINGSKAAEHYQGRHPEFMRTSQNAIGKQYALTFANEIISHNSVLANKQTQPVPTYYLKQYEKHGKNLDTLRSLREEFSQSHSIEKSYIRACKLDAKFQLKASKADQLRIRYAKDKFFDT